jgi:GT2 family glycosyltransferase
VTDARVSVIVLGYGDEPWLGQCLESILADPSVECVLVDNGIAPEVRAAIGPNDRLKVVTPTQNLGYAGGCNEGAAHASGDVLVFINSDAVVAPGAIEILAQALVDPGVGLVTGSVRLGDRPDLINAAGNPMHYLGYTWAGGIGDQAADHLEAGEVTCISGATFAVTSQFWAQLGGFDPTYFAYGEDVDLSIRTWQAGRSVRYVPEAVSYHYYEFSRNPRKWFLVERGRLINVFTLYEPRTLRYVLPMLAATELGSLLPATTQGWGKQKIAAWQWAWQNRDYLRSRSQQVQRTRKLPDAAILPRLVSRIDLPAEFGRSIPDVANTVLDRYWTWARERIMAETDVAPVREGQQS